MSLKSKIVDKVSEIQGKRKVAAAEDTKAYEEKIQAMRDSIKRFGKELSEEFILGTNMAGMFQECFGFQLGKKGSSATKRWCQDVTKKLQKLDKSNEEFLKTHNRRPLSLRMSRASGEEVESLIGEEGLSPADKKSLKAKNIKEFKKFFYNTKAFDSAFLGTEVKVKVTFSQRAAVNEFKRELNELCDPKNFEPRS